MRILVVFLLLMVSGCATRRPVEPQRVQNMVVEFEDEVSETEEGFALFCVNYILDAWADDFKRPSRFGTIRIKSARVLRDEREPLFSFPPWVENPWFTYRLSGRVVYGLFYPTQDLIRVAAGDDWTLRALYHELCHLNVARSDADHVDPRWPEWEARGHELNRELRLKWFIWLFSRNLNAPDTKVELALASRKS